MTETIHVPILVRPIVEALTEPFHKHAETAWLVDCTLGGGGHTAALLAALPPRHRMLSIDQDEAAVEAGKLRFASEIRAGRLEIAQSHFAEAGDIIGERPVLGLMADLGFSSDQIDDPSRGLSFQNDGPLDMRMDRSRGQSALEYLRNVREKDLERVLSEYGEERFAGRIASAILRKRREKELPKTTRELAELVKLSVPPAARFGRIHPATRTFQALRIVINNELKELDELLAHVILKVRPQGRVAVLSFHSLEDRKVKQAFKGEAFQALTKKPVEPSEDEMASNPRSRSAKLRVAQRTTGARA
jgi:16S rRNA (cytosine1402-N4)-methyltransferase